MGNTIHESKISDEQLAEMCERTWNRMETALYRTVTGENSRSYKTAARLYDRLISEWCRRTGNTVEDYSKPRRR